MLLRRPAGLSRQRAEAAAFERRVGHEAADHQRVGAAAAGDVLAHLGDDLRALRPAQPRQQGVAAADLRPARHQRADDARAAGAVRILIGIDLHAAGARGLDALDQRQRQAVAGRPERLHVAHDADQAGLFGDGDHFLDRGDDADRVVAFVADVAAVDAAELRRHPCECHDLPGPGVRAGRVVQPARQAERPGPHAAPHQIHHLGDLLGVGVAVGHAHDRLAHRPVRHHQADVEADALARVAPGLRVQVGRPAAVGVDDDRGDALRQHRAAVLELVGRQPAAGVRVHVDEAGGQRQALRLEGLGARRAAQPPDGGDAVADDPDIGADPRVAVAVEDAGVADQDVEAIGLARLGTGAARGRSGDGEEEGDDACERHDSRAILSPPGQGLCTAAAASRRRYVRAT